MRYTPTLMGLALAASSVNAALLMVQNRCPETLYIVYDNAQYKGQRFTLSSGQRIGILLSDLGNSVGLSTDVNFYSAAVPKLILGYLVNTDNGLVYYSLSDEAYGNPLPGRPLSITADGCQAVYSADRVTYACPDSRSISYTLCG